MISQEITNISNYYLLSGSGIINASHTINYPIYIHGDTKTLKYMTKYEWDINTIEYKEGELQHLTAKVKTMNKHLNNVVHIYSSPEKMKEIIENKKRDNYKYIIIKCIADNKLHPLQLKCSDRDEHGRKYGEGF